VILRYLMTLYQPQKLHPTTDVGMIKRITSFNGFRDVKISCHWCNM